MRLSPSQWIYVGAGSLYSTPFLCRCLLYRLYDIDSSLLIYHVKRVSSVSRTPKNIGNNTGDLDMHPNIIKEPRTVMVHFAPSTNISLDKLLRIQPISFDLPTSASASHQIGNVMVDLKPWRLPVTEAVLLDVRGSQIFESQIADTAYWVQSPAPLVHMGRRLPKKDMNGLCWKITIANTATNGIYTIDSSSDWTTVACTFLENWRPVLEVRLVRKSRSKKGTNP